MAAGGGAAAEMRLLCCPLRDGLMGIRDVIVTFLAIWVDPKPSAAGKGHESNVNSICSSMQEQGCIRKMCGW